jgi:trimeric autotransporter adhesin
MTLHVFVIKEAELEDPQDLRARSRKFLNLTNERKNMSTKTLRKRIALVAVSALGAGLLSVVAVPTANAAAGNTGTDTLQISTTASTTGEGSANQTIASQTTSGWVSKTSVNGTAGGGGFSLANGLAGTGVILAGARIAVSVGSNATSANGISLVVTGGTLNSVAQDTPDGSTSNGTLSVSGASTTAVLVQTGTTVGRMHARFAVNAAAGTTATIAAYSGTGIDDTTSATNGSLLGIWTLTVASASASGTYSAADSSIFQQAAVAKGTTAGGNAGTTVTSYDVSSRIDNGKVGVIYFDLNDAFTAAITTGTISATATNGGTVNVVDAPGSADAYAATTAFDSLTNTDGVGFVVVNQPVANTAGSSTVTITHNGTVLATKTLNWNGDVASITFDSA